MYLFQKYFLTIIIISSALSHGSQHSLINYAHGQKNAYTFKEIKKTMQNGIDTSKAAFNKGEYSTASALASGALQYIDVMKDSISRMRLELSQDTVEQLSFIIAKSSIETGSPQKALSIFETICDRQTSMGIIHSADIAESLYDKIENVTNNQPLKEKLQAQAAFFAQKASQLRIDFYANIYKDFSLENLISAIKTVDNIEQGQALVQCITRYADQNNMRALCYLIHIYNKGLCGMVTDKQKALSYAYHYVTLFAKNSDNLPFEHFCIKMTLQETSSKDMSYQVANVYFDYLQAIKNNSVEKAKNALVALNSINDTAAPLRKIIIDICMAHIDKTVKNQKKQKDKIAHLLSDKQRDIVFNSFIKTDGAIVIPLLQSLPRSDSICYLLGLLFYYKKDYLAAQNYFSICNTNASDLVTEWYLWLCKDKTSSKKTAAHLESLFPIIKKYFTPTKQKSSLHEAVFSVINNYLVEQFPQRLPFLLTNGHYNVAHRYSQLLLNNKQTMPQVIDTFLNVILSALDQHNQRKNALCTHYLFPLIPYLNDCVAAQNNTPERYINFIKLFLSCASYPNKKHIDLQIKSCLDHLNTKKQYLSSHQTEMGDLYYLLAQEYSSMDYYNKALGCEHIDAIYGKALLLLEKQHIKQSEQQALELLKKHAQSQSPLRHLSQYKLGELYFHYSVQENLLKHTKPDRLLSFEYLTQAAQNDSKEAYGLLGVFYAQGSKNSDGTWSQKPDPEKALEYLDQCNYVPAPCAQEILFHRGVLYRNNALSEKALLDFNALELSSLPKEEQEIVQQGRIWLLLCSFAEQEKQGRQVENDTINDCLTKVHLICQSETKTTRFTDDDVVNFLINKTTNIISTKQIDSQALAICSIAGILLHNKFIKPTENKEKSKLHGVRCLRYAAEHGDLFAQINASGLDNIHIPPAQKINYLLKAYVQAKKENNANNCQVVKTILQDCIPIHPFGQYNILKEYINNNDMFMARLYLELLHFMQPSIVFLKDTPLEEIDATLKDCRNNVFLQNLASNVLTKAPHLVKNREQGAAFLRASIYALSTDKNELLANVKYLNALSGTFNTQFILGATYYQLSLIFKAEKQLVLHQAYLKKAIEYRFPLALEECKIAIEELKKK